MLVISTSYKSLDKKKKSMPPSLKTGNLAYRCRTTLNLRRKPNDNLRRPFGDVSLTGLWIIEINRWGRPNKKSGSCQKMQLICNISVETETYPAQFYQFYQFFS